MDIDMVVSRIKTGSRTLITFQVPEEATLPLADLFRLGRDKTGERYRLRLSLPFRGRTTGAHSQNHRINGFIAQISRSTNIPFDGLKEWIKIQSIGEGYPHITLPDGECLGQSETKISVEEASILIGTIERIAAEWGVALREE